MWRRPISRLCGQRRTGDGSPQRPWATARHDADGGAIAKIVGVTVLTSGRIGMDKAWTGRAAFGCVTASRDAAAGG